METETKKTGFSHWKELAIASFAIGIALLVWFTVGQIVGQSNLYGFYSDFRMMFGLSGAGFAIFGFCALLLGK